MRAGQRERGVLWLNVAPLQAVVLWQTSHVLREARPDVVRIGCAVVVRLMARNAGRIRARQVVVPVDMALRALHRRVRPGQREAGRGVVERRRCPVGGGVALVAGLREAGLHVIRIRRSLVIRQVAL